MLWFEERGSGPAMVLIHGFPLDGRIWAAQLADLSDRFRVIVPDLRGFGRSHSTEPFTIESLADDLRSLLVDLKALPCTLAGLSMGGYVSLAYAKKYRADLTGLILVDSRADADSPRAKEARGKMIDLVRSGGTSAVADAMMPRMTAPNPPPTVVQRLKSIMLDCPPLTIEHALVAMREREDHSPHLNCVSRVIVGEHDVISPQSLPWKCEVKVIPGAGHMSPMERPRLVSDCLAAPLAGRA
jgi:3-oxoadipate enol-lactonase